MRIEDLILAARDGGPRGLTADEVAAAARELELPDDLVVAHMRFTPAGYARNLILRTPSFEILVLCWLPGQETEPHDHGGNVGAVRVYKGTLTSRLFQARDGKPAELLSDDGCPPGAVAAVGVPDIHQLGNHTEEEVVSIHIYSRPLSVIGTYSTTSPQREQTRLRYTVGDDLT